MTESELGKAAGAAREPASDATALLAPLRTTARGDFVAILDRLALSLVAATQPRQLVLLGARDGQLTTFNALVSNPMGVAVDGDRLAVATAHSIVEFVNAAKLAPHYPPRPNHHDAFFVPKTIHMTGLCRWHDITFARNAVIGMNTQFSCVCRIDGAFHFTPLWRPSFVSALCAEDRCHLNGFTGENFELSYVTALGATDTEQGWRPTLETGGLLIDARRNVILRSDLCLPHSPRLVGEELYVLNSGQGEVLRVDRGTGASIVLARLPGFTHGLCHHAGILFVGLSKNRLSRVQSPVPIAQREPNLVAGIAAVDMRSGAVLGSVEFEEITEVYDVQPMPGIRRAGVQSLVQADPCEAIVTPNAGFWRRRSKNDGPLAEAAASGNYHVSLHLEVGRE